MDAEPISFTIKAQDIDNPCISINSVYLTTRHVGGQYTGTYSKFLLSNFEDRSTMLVSSSSVSPPELLAVASESISECKCVSVEFMTPAASCTLVLSVLLMNKVARDKSDRADCTGALVCMRWTSSTNADVDMVLRSPAPVVVEL